MTGVKSMAIPKNMFMNMGISLNTAPIIDRNRPIPIEKNSKGNRVNGNKRISKEGATL